MTILAAEFKLATIYDATTIFHNFSILRKGKTNIGVLPENTLRALVSPFAMQRQKS